MVSRDYQEVVTFSFVSSDWERDIAGNDAAVRVLNPIASHLDVMRSTLAGSLIEVLRTNVARRQARARIFEIGRCFLRDGDEVGFRQPLRLGGLAFGDATDAQWSTPARGVDFFDVKGDIAALAVPRMITTVAGRHPALHPGRSARVLLQGNDIGWLGELHPRLVRRYELPSAPLLFELELSPLLQVDVPAARAVSRQPVVRRDLAVVVDEDIPAQALLSSLDAGKPATVEGVALFDLYRGTGIPPGKKSLAILVLMQDTQRTLTDTEIEENVAQLVRLLEEKFGASLR
jgi:phenylalanyl-tRNA synthetase beta chain